jgi:hypothetical protein
MILKKIIKSGSSRLRGKERMEKAKGGESYSEQLILADVNTVVSYTSTSHCKSVKK